MNTLPGSVYFSSFLVLLKQKQSAYSKTVQTKSSLLPGFCFSVPDGFKIGSDGGEFKCKVGKNHFFNNVRPSFNLKTEFSGKCLKRHTVWFLMCHTSICSMTHY